MVIQPLSTEIVLQTQLHYPYSMYKKHIYQFMFLLSFYLCSVTTSIRAQVQSQEKIWIEGKVVTQEGYPISAVSVYLKNGSITGTVTDASGVFKLACKEGSHVLVFTHTAYEAFETVITVKKTDDEHQYYDVYLKEKSIHLREVMITSQRASTVPSLQSIKNTHKLIAGGTSVAVMTPEAQRLETIKDALKYEPGVVVQEFFGANDQPRISIRGSGIQSNPQRRGIYLLQDGIPVNFSDGSFVVSVIDPMTAQYVEVFKGANALRYGAATLGGALNFVSRNGIHNKGLLVKLEGGSFGYGSISMMGGGNKEKNDAYLSLSASRQDGFRPHNKNEKLNIAFNVGHRFSSVLENRTYLNFSNVKFDIPGPLTMEMIKEDPFQISTGVNLPYSMGPDIARDKPGRDITMFRIANKTAWQYNQHTQLTAALYYQYAYDRFAFPIVLSTQRSQTNDMGITVQLITQQGRHRISSGIVGSYGINNRNGHINKNGEDSYRFSSDRLSAPNITLYVEDDYAVSEKLHVIANIQAVYNERNSKDVFPEPELRPWYSHSSHKYRYFHSENISLHQSYRTINPRIGVVYNIDNKKRLQLFGNAGTSYEPPTFDELTGTQVTENINTSPKKLFTVQLKQQQAFTIEAGSRFTHDRYAWNISVYHSWLRNELLEVKDFVLGVKTTRNYPHSIHSGVEASVMAIPLQGILSVSGKDHLSIRAMYNYSRFRFSSGAYKGNQLAGVAPHYLTAALEYKYSKGVFAAINIESQPQATYIDHSNTLQQPAYTIYGARAGYLGIKNCSFYIECKNIFNRYYASGYVVSDEIHNPALPFPDFSANNMAFFIPGPVRAFYAGFTYQL